MFKKLIPVIALALIAGPVLAADPPATGSDHSSSTSGGKSHHGKGKHHGKGGSKAHKPASSSSGDTSNAPAK